jgi:PPK2 family polyphosphate:nucleotide phosphotransferase
MPYAHLIKPGTDVDLNEVSTSHTSGLTKEEGRERLAVLGARMAELQELLFAAGRNSLLIVLQGRDTSGKDGAIKRILEFVNVQTTRVVGFKQPTEVELAHDFLWRVHGQVPALGGVTIFNRSHYEDVLVVRVHDLVPKEVWQGRYDQINAFEALLTNSNTILLKFLLHISKEEQEARLLAREEDPVKAWKLSVGDWKEREHWDAYTQAYNDVLERCSTPYAPWRVVPADQKWFRDLAIAEAVVEALEPYEAGWRAELERIGREAKAEIEAYRGR